MAFAANDEVEKLRYVLYIKEIPTIEGRNAEFLMWKRRSDEAESLLLQSGLTWRAINMNIRLFKWERALELAAQHKMHVDTVLAYRQVRRFHRNGLILYLTLDLRSGICHSLIVKRHLLNSKNWVRVSRYGIRLLHRGLRTWLIYHAD